MRNVEEWVQSESRIIRTQHLNLNDDCIERGGNSTNHRGVLAQYLNTTIPNKTVYLCHACHNGKCSNPHHLYWGSRSENEQDAHHNGKRSIYQLMVNKYGVEETKRRMRSAGRLGGLQNRGKTKSEEHKKMISKALQIK